MSSSKCDVITGFHFQDSSNLHILMLEGLHGSGVQQLWTGLPRHHTQGQPLLLGDAPGAISLMILQMPVWLRSSTTRSTHSHSDSMQSWMLI